MRIRALFALSLAMFLKAGDPPLLLQNPTLSRTRIAFEYAGQIWDVARQGGAARRLVAGEGRCLHPIYSPDGSRIAFTGYYDGNYDVYVVPAEGGQPQRLTYHPGADKALGWSPDGQRIIFNSLRATARDLPQLFSVALTGGLPEPLPLPSGDEASFSPDGTHLAYTPFSQWQPAWKKYRGGQTARVWIADLSDSSIVKIPRGNSNDRDPMWAGDTVYFLSDRGGPFTLYAYDTKTKAVRQAVENADGFDISSASAGPGGIVYHQFGSLRLYDFASGKSFKVPVTLSADLPGLRPHFEKVEASQILHAALSPSGKRAVFETRGELLSVPAEKGDARNLTRSPGVADRDPAWSPDGKWIAWFSDESGEYSLHLRAPDGLGAVRNISLGQPPSYFYGPRWSPDSRKIAYTDTRMNLWVVDIDHPAPMKLDADLYDTPAGNLDPAWSPDSRWVAYAKQLPNHLHGVFIYGLDEKKSRQVTDGLSDAFSPRFDKSGKYLYFLAGTNTGLSAGWLDMTSLGHPVSSGVYAAVLRKDLPSPLAPESDEEAAKAGATDKKAAAKDARKDGEDGKQDEPESPEPVRIDFDGLGQRVISLPVDMANYTMLETGPSGVIFLVSGPTALTDEESVESQGVPSDVTRFDLKTRKGEKVLEGIVGSSPAYGGLVSFAVSADGSKLLFARQSKWSIVASDKPAKPGEGGLKLDAVRIAVDPRAEWRQMYREVWRIERDFFYDPHHHGLDLAKAEKTYEPFLDGIASREDLNTLFEEMTGWLVVGHTFIRGGDAAKQDAIGVGLLGADYRVAEGRYQFAEILQGENWNPHLKAPLTAPGVNVKAGDFLLAVNGEPLKGGDDVYRLFQGTAGKQTVLTVGAKADGAGSRQVTVVPVGSESQLRLRSWMDANRREVDRLSGGRLAYVYIPDTAAGGFANFNRYYFSQVGKQGAVLDERFNHGGDIADYIIENLKRTPQMVNTAREGAEVVEPAQAIFGPKVMIINQMSGSGGDALPWLFKKEGVGPLIGVRTWGGLVGIGGYPPLMDGGSVTAPRWGLYGTKGEWEVENIGIGPDIEVEQDPALTRKGQDPQLERAVQEALDLLAKNPQPVLKKPPYPDYKQVLPKLEP
ncbi:MAG TPA: PDZ domain-containing protein [Holophagaceae bacterium]|nr:PDZ domain-containing protein [Holophagaceae bacterium]